MSPTAAIVRIIALLVMGGIVASKPTTPSLIVAGGAISAIAVGRAWEWRRQQADNKPKE